MHCLVTAGPAIEPLDEVRRLTNLSTGRLGCLLSDSLSRAGNNVTLLLSEFAQNHPKEKTNSIIKFNTSKDLGVKLCDASSEYVDAVFHVAAVSDFCVADIRNADSISPVKERKISSRNGNLIVELKPAPKIIGYLRGYYPKAQIIGWKYEVDGNRVSSIAKAHEQIHLYKTDACVVNGPAYGDGFGVITPNDSKHLKSSKMLLSELTQSIDSLNLSFRK